MEQSTTKNILSFLLSVGILSFPLWGGVLFWFIDDLRSALSNGKFLGKLYIALALCCSQPIFTLTKISTSIKYLIAIVYYVAVSPICFIFFWGLVGMA
jgi:hypothetical protein